VRVPRFVNSLVAGAMIGLLVLVPVAAGWAEGPGAETHNPAAEYAPVGNGYCFANTLVVAGITIGGNRCYNFYLLRTTVGNFLGFGPPGPPIVAPGQILRLNTPAGAQIRSRMLYMVPLPASATTTLPVNAAQFVTLRIGAGAARALIFTVPTGGQSVELGVAQR
jgi:hypothetical protein